MIIMSFCNPSNYCNDWCVHLPNERKNDTKNHHWRANNTVSGQTIRLRRDNGSTTETTTVTAAWSGHVSKLRSWYVVMGHVLMKQAWRSLKNSTLCCNYSDFNKRHEDAWSTLDCPTSSPNFPFLCPSSLTSQRQEMTRPGREVLLLHDFILLLLFFGISITSMIPSWCCCAIETRQLPTGSFHSWNNTFHFDMGNCLNSGPTPETINRDSQTRLQTPNPVKVEHFPNRPWQYLNMNIQRHAHRASYRLPR